jgi:hypothetical protein
MFIEGICKQCASPLAFGNCLCVLKFIAKQSTIS